MAARSGDREEWFDSTHKNQISFYTQLAQFGSCASLLTRMFQVRVLGWVPWGSMRWTCTGVRDTGDGGSTPSPTAFIGP